MSEPADDLDRTEHPEEMWVKKEFGLLVHRLEQLPARSRAKLQSDFTQKLMAATVPIDTPRGPLSFVLQGKTAAGRAMTLLTKEPGTIAWIDRFAPNSVFWDVGANVGVYTLYAGLRGDTTVVAFEPAAVNYFLLSANCEVNNMDDRVTCLLLGLGSERSIARLEVSQLEPAKSFSFLGKTDQPRAGRQAALILSMDQLVEEYGIACPNYIKVDAPGLSEAIIAGGARLLERPDVRELHIEVREQSKGGQRILELLKQRGFVAVSRNAHGGSADLTFKRQDH